MQNENLSRRVQEESEGVKRGKYQHEEDNKKTKSNYGWREIKSKKFKEKDIDAWKSCRRWP